MFSVVFENKKDVTAFGSFLFLPRRNPVVGRRTSWGHDILILTKRQSKEPPRVWIRQEEKQDCWNIEVPMFFSAYVMLVIVS